MNNVRTEQTLLWFHSADSLIARNDLAWKTEKEAGNVENEETGKKVMTQAKMMKRYSWEEKRERKETGVSI